MHNAKCIKSWSYSLNGFSVKTAAEGDELTLPESLLADGVITGHLKPVGGKKGKKADQPVDENKSIDPVDEDKG